MDLTLVGTFLVALFAGYFSWKQLQNDDDININEEQESALYEPKKKPSKTKNNKGGNKNKGNTTRRSSTSQQSTVSEKNKVVVEEAKIVETVQVPVVEASKPAAAAPVSSKNSGFNVKSACDQIKSILSEAENSDKREKLLEQAKLMETDAFKQTSKELNQIKKQLERELEQSAKSREELAQMKKNLEIAVKDNNEFKAKNKRVADQARQEVAKELEAKESKLNQLKSDYNKLKKEYDGFTSSEEEWKKKYEGVKTLNAVLQSTVAEGVKAQRLANAAADNAVSVENAPEFKALKAENEKLAKDLKSAENSKKQAENSKNQLKESVEKSKKDLQKSENSRKQAENSLKQMEDSKKEVESQLKTAQNAEKAVKSQLETAVQNAEKAVNSKVGELQDQVDALKIQLSTAQNEAKVAQEAAGGDASELVSVKKDLENVRAELEQTNVSHEKTSKEIWQKLDQANSEKDKVVADLASQTKKTADVQSNLDELTGTYDTVSNELNDYKVTLSEVQVKLESFESVENQLKTENASLKAQLDQYSNENASLKAQLDQKSTSTPVVDTSKINELNNQISILTAEKSEFEAKSQKAEQKLEKTLVMLNKIEAHVNEEAENLAKIQSDKEAVTQQLAASESECNNLKETVTQIKTKLVGLQAAFDGQVDDLNKKINSLENENASLKAVKVDVPVVNGNHQPINGNAAAGDSTSPASEKWVMLNGGENRQSVQSMSDSDADDKGTPV